MSPNPQVLLSHVGWVRSLAHCLVSDPQLAEDLAQETWVSALQSPPRYERNMRGWLATVLRNLVRQNRRASGRRTTHEQGVARPDRVPSTAELVERASSHRALVEAVLSLDEPYRSAVLLRFFEGIPPRRIAQQLQLPVSTVQTRLQRGLKMLRARLDRQHGGDHRSWLFALIPIAQKNGGATAALLGVLLMKTKLQILFGTLIVAVGLVAAWPLITGGAAAPANAAGPESVSVPLVATDRGEASSPEVLQRDPLSVQPGSSPERNATAPGAVAVSGRLLDGDGRPLAGMGLQFGPGLVGIEDGEPIATSGAAGEFQFLAEGGSGRIAVHEPGWTTVLAAIVNAERPPEHALVVAARAMRLGGRVVDEFGMPVAGATVSVALPQGFRTRFRENSDAAGNRAWQVTSGEDGTFGLADVAQISGAEVVATNPGHDEHRQPQPAADELGLEIILRRTTRADDTVSGQVLDPLGAIVAGAWVAIGSSSTKSDEQGNFTLKLSDQGPVDRILAIKEGYQPARLSRPVDASGEATDWPSTIVLRLGAQPLSIAGQVVNDDGEPVSEARVWANDPTLFGRADGGMVTVEGVAGGGATRSVLSELLQGMGSEPEAMAVIERTPRADWAWVRTDADGRFVLNGLTDREYQLRAIIDDTLLMVDTAPVQAGRQDVVIRMPADGYYSTVAGQVVSYSGAPIAGVTVRPMSDPFVMRYREQPLGTMHATGGQTVTDADGRFELRRMPRTDVYLRLDGEDILPMEYGRFVEGGIQTLSGGAVESMSIVVAVRVHVQVELNDPASADRVRVLDNDGNAVTINVFAGNSRQETSTLQLVDGRSPVMVVPDSAVRMVFLKGSDEVHTVNLGLIPGEVNRIRW